EEHPALRPVPVAVTPCAVAGGAEHDAGAAANGLAARDAERRHELVRVRRCAIAANGVEESWYCDAEQQSHDDQREHQLEQREPCARLASRRGAYPVIHYQSCSVGKSKDIAAARRSRRPQTAARQA